MKHLKYPYILIAFVGFAGCDSAAPTKTNINNHSDATVESANTSEYAALKSAGVLLPEGSYKASESDAISDEQRARKVQGARGVFQDMHLNQGVTLLPEQTSASLNLVSSNSQPVTIDQNIEERPESSDAGGSDPATTTAQCNADEEKKVCVKACATATANAYAAAFAHASATSCAWAKAWACVFSFRPFTKVCSWAKSEVCVTSFSSAFAAAFDSDTQTVCNSQCK
jgi:hypothetical protein